MVATQTLPAEAACLWPMTGAIGFQFLRDAAILCGEFLVFPPRPVINGQIGDQRAFRSATLQQFNLLIDVKHVRFRPRHRIGTQQLFFFRTRPYD